MMWRRKAQPSEPVQVLLRHADAGLRAQWRGSDEWRGLTDAGHGQARAVVRMIEDLPVERILSSPSLRCRQTVVPLALARALDVEPCWQLGAGVAVDDPIALLADPATASAVVCTHRETLQLLFEHLADVHEVVAEAAEPMEKGAVWILRGAVGGPQAPRLDYLGSAAALVV
jgi:phosphohistidine phosphatase SixA